MANKVVVTVLQRVSHRRVERWEPVRMRKGEYGLGNSAYVSGQVIKSKQHHIYTFALD